ASAGLMVLNRGFSYSDIQGPSEMLQPYSLPLGPALALGGEWYPGAHFSNGLAAHLGLVGGFQHSFLLSSAGPEGATFDTTDSAWNLGAQLRIPLDRSRLTFHAT